MPKKTKEPVKGKTLPFKTKSDLTSFITKKEISPVSKIPPSIPSQSIDQKKSLSTPQTTPQQNIDQSSSTSVFLPKSQIPPSSDSLTSISSPIIPPENPSKSPGIDTFQLSLKKNNSEKNPSIVKRYFQPDSRPIGDNRYQANNKRDFKEASKSWHLRCLKQASEIVSDLKKGILLTVEYDGQENKAYAKFYDLTNDTIKIWLDTTDHEPYCLHERTIEDLSQNSDLTAFPGYKRMETIQKFDLIQDREKSMTKIYGHTPTDIGGANSIRELLEGAWEANIRYHHNFIYDRNLIPGMIYRIKDGKPEQIPTEIDARMENQLMQQFQKENPAIQEMARYYNPIFSTPVPPLKRMAFDIEVAETPDGALPEPTLAKYPVISIAFASTDGKKMVYVLDRPNLELGEYPKEFPKEAEVFFFKEERNLLIEAFRILWTYPIIITFNGDNFDNTYLYHRAKNLKIDDAINPIVVERGASMMISRKTDYKHGIHIDIFQFFANRSIKGYAFGGVYLKNSLEDISFSLLSSGKIKHEGTLIGAMTLADLIHYNLNDAIITLELVQFNQQLVFNLMVILMRITKLPLQDIFRLQISAWIRSLFYFEHRRKNFIIPRRDDMSEVGEEGFSDSVIEGKSFQGAYVVDPIPGIHFNVAVMDFSSLYPSIIKTRNLSYETINCNHDSCKENMLPNTPYWACNKRMGIFAYVVGLFRDIRIKWFKPLSGDKSLSSDQRNWAKVVQNALKVFINGAYGVFGSEQFPLFSLPVAECTTAIGRFSIQQTIKQAESMGVKVLYGDSDSVFLAHPSQDQIQSLTSWAEKNLDLDLDLDKIYQFLALSERKKNYIGVRKGGEEVDLKGLMAKKHNTPEFIKKKFSDAVYILKQIIDLNSFKEKRTQIIQIVKETNKFIGKLPEEGGFPLDDYAISIVLQKHLTAYNKTIPQHVRAAMMLPSVEQKALEPGSFINFVKTRSKEGVKPISMATIADIDITKYKELVQSTFEQVLDALGIDYQEILGVKKLTSFL